MATRSSLRAYSVRVRGETSALKIWQLLPGWAKRSQFFAHGLVKPDQLPALFLRAEPDLVRYPGIDAEVLRQKVAEMVGPADRSG